MEMRKDAAPGEPDFPDGFTSRDAFARLENRIKIFLSLPLAGLDRLALQQRLNAIGRTPPSAAAA